MKFRNDYAGLISKGMFTSILTKRDKVFAYTRTYQGDTIVVVGNMDFKHPQRRVTLKVAGIKKKSSLDVIHGMKNYKTGKNKIYTDLDSGEIKVFKLGEVAL